MIKLSIIVPVYNVEQYLKRCIESIIAQDIPSSEFEIIIVNDGSQDSSEYIIKEYTATHENIISLKQKNQGLSGARNTGIRHAHGKYIWFVDSDDYLKDNIVGSILKIAEQNNTDILFFHLEERYNNKSKITCIQNITSNSIISGREAIINGYNPCSACAALFSKSFITENDLFFYVGITHEDVEFTYKATICATRVLFTNLVTYIYDIRPNSLTTSLNPKSMIKNYVDNIYIVNSFNDLAKKISDDKILESTILNRGRDIIFGNIFNLWRQRNKLKHDNMIKTILQIHKEYGYYPLKAPFKSWKHYLIAKFLLNKKFY